MLSKLLAVFLVAMLMLPTTALAVGKPDFAGAKSEGKAVDNKGSGAEAEVEGEEEDARPAQTGKGNGSASGVGKPSTTPASGKGGSDQKGSASGAGRAMGEEMRSKAEAIKAEKQAEAEAKREAKKAETEAEAAAETEPEVIGEETETVEGDNAPEDEAVSEEQEGAKNGKIGLARAMEAISANIAKVGGGAVKALTKVYNKFASWLGLPFLNDTEAPADAEEGDGTGSNEESATVEPDDGLGGGTDTDTPELDDGTDPDAGVVEPTTETSN